MYIQKVRLQNFRSFGNEGICFLFDKGINAVIGENNNGKTALIDAIRIAFSCVLYKKDIFFSKTFHHTVVFFYNSSDISHSYTMFMFFAFPTL